MIYVVTSERLRDYLNALGFYHRTDNDNKDKTKEVFLFKKTELLLEAITYYSQFKLNNNINN